MEMKAEDEYLHPPLLNDPLWMESYHFNGYDPANKMGITIYRGIKSVLRFKVEIVTLYAGNPLLFRNPEEFESEDTLNVGSLKMEPLQPLKKWRIQMNDSFQKIENGNPSNTFREVKFDLYFDSNTSIYAFSTHRGNRYEQPGLLKGRMKIGEKTIDFEGRGIRDHSWEIRNVPNWGEYYWLMGCFGSGEAVSFSYMRVDSNPMCHGWLKTDKYNEVRNVQVSPRFSGEFLKRCKINVETSKKELELSLQVISFLPIPKELMTHGSLPTEERKRKSVENLIELDGGKGYGIMWYGR